MEELMALAASGATTLVGLMVSDSWTQAKKRLGTFFARARGAGAGSQELEATRDAVARARAAGDAQGVADIEAGLHRRLLDMLNADPAAAGDLRSLLAEWAPAVSHTAMTGGVYHGPVFSGAHIHGGITFQVPQPATSRGARPDQVPVLTAPFSNRVRELAALDQLCGSGAVARGVNIGAVDGLPGVGKSAFVRRWAATAGDHFPDGQLYVDFAALPTAGGDGAGTGPGSADVSEALAMLLRSLRPETTVPVTLAERANLYRTCTAGLRLLLVLDAVTTPAQVRALLPKGPGSVLLATSRGRLGELTLDGARLISLDPLDDEGGLALLADRCGHDTVAGDRDAATRLVAYCGGLPVALQIVAARLLLDPHLTTRALADELQDETRRLAGMALPGAFGPEYAEGAENVGNAEGSAGSAHSVTAVLSTAVRLLTEAAARLHRLLGWLPHGDFDAGVAAVAADLPVEEARRLLRELVAARLVETLPDGRHRMHDLVRLYARECAARAEPEGERRALVRRVTLHYLVLVAFADRALRRDRLRIADLSDLLDGASDPFAAEGGPSPLDWLDTERAAVLAVLRAAVDHELYGLAWPLAEGFTALFLHHRHLAAWTESLELGARAAASVIATAATAGEIAEATAGEARLRSLMSRPLTDLGDHERAGAELERAVACAEVTAHLVLRASVQEFLGRHLERTDPAAAVGAYRRSLDLNRQAGEARGAALATLFLGQALDGSGDHDTALATLHEARRDLLALPEPDVRMAARALVALGTAQDHTGRAEEAVRSLREAVDDLEAQGALHYAAQALERLAGIALRTGSHQNEVRTWLTRAITLHESTGNPAAAVLRRRLAVLDGAQG